ncbi:MAG: tetratricopeptide repeat protein [Syntrophorhabdaceae bacterium]|nr:tetratricopeptide repeat protein [Syntrophorhabdaceae bacterium]
MRYKIFFFVLALFLVFYFYIAHLNPENVKFYYGGARPVELSLAEFIIASFCLGVIISIIISFFYDVKTTIASWMAKRSERKSEEYLELLEKARHYDLKGDRDKAIEHLDKLSRTNPGREETYIALADIYVSMEDYEKARGALDLAEASIGKAENVLFKKVKVNIASRDFSKNESVLKDILLINESSLKALKMLRDLYIWKKDWAGAYDVELKIKRHVKTDEEARRLIGIRYEKAYTLFNERFSENVDKIIDDLKEIISDDKRFIPAYILLGEAYKKAGKLNEAGRIYGRGYTKTGHIEFLLKMEDLYIDRGDPGVILKIYQRVLDVSPEDHLISFLYARLCLRLEMIDEAIDTLNTLIAEGEDFKGLHRAMAEAYIHRGELENAVEEFRGAFPIEQQVYIPFFCTKCQAIKEEWSDFCESCYSWNTINVKKEEFLHADMNELRTLYDEAEWTRGDSL